MRTFLFVFRYLWRRRRPLPGIPNLDSLFVGLSPFFATHPQYIDKLMLTARVGIPPLAFLLNCAHCFNKNKTSSPVLRFPAIFVAKWVESVLPTAVSKSVDQ